MSDFRDHDFSSEDEQPSGRQRPERRGIDINDLPVWTWVAILLVVVVVGGALWLMTRGDETAGAPTATPTAEITATAPASEGAGQPTGMASPAASGLITPTPVIGAATPLPAEPVDLAVGGRAIVTGTGGTQLRVRAGPGTDYATLVIVPDGTELTILEGPQSQDGYEWWRLQFDDGTTGWAVEQYLMGIAR